MLHNKELRILEQFLGNYKENVYGRQVSKEVSFSQKNVSLILKRLEEKGILKYERKGNIKNYFLNIENTEIKDFLLMAEINKKVKFMKRYRELAHFFANISDEGIVGIFGSYARGEETKNSDIDLFVIGGGKKDYDKEGERQDLNISTKYFSLKEFKKLLKEKNNFAREIIENHILVFNSEKFIKLIWGEYYGFD